MFSTTIHRRLLPHKACPVLAVTCVLWLFHILWTGKPVAGQSAGENRIPVKVQVLPLTQQSAACTGHFVAHDLDHITTTPNPSRIGQTEGFGEGVAIGDLDGDGRLDIVLANYSGANTILWNEGGLNFSTQRLAPGGSRAVTLVDVDGDGKLDIVFSQDKSAPLYWHNDGNRHFTRQALPGVSRPLYAINWAASSSGDSLDLVGATYDATLWASYGQDFPASGMGGVYYYENTGGQFVMHRLATSAQATALILIDLNGDGHPDIWVGNDFIMPDAVWLWSKSGWQRAFPLKAMSYSTMSLDYGDLNNDGHIEVFSTDMKPYPGDVQGEAVLGPVLAAFARQAHQANDPQIHANVLQTVGVFKDTAVAAGVDATGWSWSGKFGDLDNDGFQDLYVVNGYMELVTFPDLPNHELVEENQAFRNDGHGKFVRMPQWGLGSTRSGRGMVMADLEGNGKLDIVVNNLNSPAQLFENQLCAGSSLEVDLFWPNSHNTRAIGATLVLSSDAAQYRRDVKAASGYLSGDPARVHFGYPNSAKLQQLTIRWPDSSISVIPGPPGNSILEVTRLD